MFKCVGNCSGSCVLSSVCVLHKPKFHVFAYMISNFVASLLVLSPYSLLFLSFIKFSTILSLICSSFFFFVSSLLCVLVMISVELIAIWYS